MKGSRTWGVGETPLLEIRGISEVLTKGIRLFAKAEWFNPGGSVKDRPVLRMLQEGESAAALLPGKTILDAVGGNAGASYAWIGARLRHKVKLVTPASIGESRKRLLLAFGAELVLTDPRDGQYGALVEARRIFAADPTRYFFPDQSSNPANWRAHYETTAEEVWRQTEGRVTHFVAGLGTSGTFVGTGRRLRELNASVRLVSVEPDSALHGLEGLAHLGTAMIPAIYDPALADEKVSVPTEAARQWIRRLARACGILAGVSSGAALVASLRVCEAALARGEEATVVTVFPDSGERYLNESFWDGAAA